MLSTPNQNAEEKAPLLQKSYPGEEFPDEGDKAKISPRAWMNPSALLKRFRGMEPVVDTMTYDTEMLMTWKVFFLTGVTTAWQKKSTWAMMGSLFLVSLVVAVVTVFANADPAQMKGTKFKEIGLFLRIFVGLLLGFFLTSSTNRWYQCVNGFMVLFDAVRNLQMQFMALGIPANLRFHCIRYGFISGILLDHTLRMEKMDDNDRIPSEAIFWKELVDESAKTSDDLFEKGQAAGNLDEANVYRMITPTEAKSLMMAGDPAGMMWYWVGSLVGRMAQDGYIPPMASPTYGRIMNLAQTAHGGIRQIKWSVGVQAPFMYVHMLASLVHINNLINAISFGINLGTVISSSYVYHGLQATGVLPHLENAKVTHKEMVRDMENLVVMMFIGLVGPLIYQSLLDVAIEVSQPFAKGYECSIPTNKLLDRLEADLSEASMSLQSPPGWEAPCFKAPPAPK